MSRNSVVVSAAACERDEYFDNDDGSLDGGDVVVRVRYRGEEPEIAFKGPRSWTGSEYSRTEIEFPCRSREEFEVAVAKKGLKCTWYFEKRRELYLWKDGRTKLFLDEIPDFGFFVEIEGEVKAIRNVSAVLKSALGEQESRNYKDVYLALKAEQGIGTEGIRGAEFAK
jgi:predicted adenylyl cyclase CyaB